jgi:uncharacterized membrane protein YcaP (DUF421 family)
MFFEGWAGLLRVVVVGTLAYVALVLLLRVTGKRTLSKMNAFDLVVTVALGSTLATVLLSEDVALAEGVLAFALLILLQFAITWLSVRSAKVQAFIKAEPRLLLHHGRLLPGALRRERLTEDEIRAAIRSQGIASLDEVAAVVLETDGSVSVLRHVAESGASALANVAGHTRDTMERGEPAASGPSRTSAISNPRSNRP